MSNFGQPRPSQDGRDFERGATGVFWTLRPQHAWTIVTPPIIIINNNNSSSSSKKGLRSRIVLLPCFYLPRFVGAAAVVIETVLVRPAWSGFESTSVMFQPCAQCRGIRATRTGLTQQIWKRDKARGTLLLSVGDRQMPCGRWRTTLIPPPAERRQRI